MLAICNPQMVQSLQDVTGSQALQDAALARPGCCTGQALVLRCVV